MEFIKGIMAGAMIGMTVGVMKSQDITRLCKKGKKTLRKMKMAGFFN